VTDYTTKDSGRRQEFSSGARRDTQAGKPRYDLIPPGPLRRIAELYARGAVKYGETDGEMNWVKGMPSSRVMGSLLRHVELYRDGDRTEDHPAAICWNALALMFFEGTEFDDLDQVWVVGPRDPKLTP